MGARWYRGSHLLHTPLLSAPLALHSFAPVFPSVLLTLLASQCAAPPSLPPTAPAKPCHSLCSRARLLNSYGGPSSHPVSALTPILGPQDCLGSSLSGRALPVFIHFLLLCKSTPAHIVLFDLLATSRRSSERDKMESRSQTWSLKADLWILKR